jgi:isocitrate dehydrogenase (NAD+)
MFDPAGGTAPDIAGKNVANPTAALLSLSNLLRHLGEIEAGASVRRAILDAIAAGCGTRDVGGTRGTTEFTAEVVGRSQDSLARA